METKTIAVYAADFIDNIEEGYAITDSRFLGDSWLHNNLGLVMERPWFKTKDHRVRSYGSRDPISTNTPDVSTRVYVPEAGRYRLFVRSHGDGQSAFSVSIGGKTDPNQFGDSPISWKRGGSYELAKGETEVTLRLIAPEPCFDMLVLSTDEAFNGDEVPRDSLPEDVEVLREYAIPYSGTVKFGMLTDDGRIGFVVFGPDWSAYAYDHDGKQLWTYEAPPLSSGMGSRREFEPPGVIWDIDSDGNGEVIHWRQIDGSGMLVIADGRTGEIKRRTAFPSVPPDACNNYRLAVARLRPGYPQGLIVFADSGGTISVNAYDKDLELLWSHVEKRKKDNLGHYIYPRDINGDGVDEIFVGALALDSEGKVLWDRLDSDNNNHVDSMRFADVNGDGKDEIVAVYSGLGVHVIDTNTGESIWARPAEHAQQLEVGDFLKGVPPPHIAAGARIYSSGKHYLYGQIYWYDSQGRLLLKWPKTSINGNPDFAKGDLLGDGTETLFWYRFKMNEDGKGELYLREQVYHMFDFMGEGAENVVTVEGGKLRVYRSRLARRDKANARRDTDYMYRKVANHTHY